MKNTENTKEIKINVDSVGVMTESGYRIFPVRVIDVAECDTTAPYFRDYITKPTAFHPAFYVGDSKKTIRKELREYYGVLTPII